MKTAELNREYRRAIGAVEQSHLDRLVALGVTWDTLAELAPGGWAVPFGVTSIAPGDDGLFCPGSGALHVIQPVMAGDQIIDLCAWRSGDPAAWRLRTGLGAYLGDLDELVDAALWSPESATPIRSTPLDWLRAGGVGICVINWSAPELRELLRLPHIVVPDGVIAKMLRAALTRPYQLPQISVAEEARHAA